MWSDPASRDLFNQIRFLRAHAGMPSSRITARRAIEQSTIAAVSHSTVAQLFNGSTIPSWDLLEAIVLGLYGDPADFRPLWERAQTHQQTASAKPSAWAYTQFVCHVADVAVRYNEMGADGWEPVNAFAGALEDPALVHMVMRRRATWCDPGEPA